MDPMEPGPSNRRQDEDLKADPRSWESIMASVESLSDAEKLAVAESKYKDILKQCQELETEISVFREKQRKAEILENLASSLEVIKASIESLSDKEKMALAESKYKGILKQCQEMEADISVLRENRKKAEILENLTRSLNKPNKKKMQDDAPVKSKQLKVAPMRKSQKTISFHPLVSKFHEHDVHSTLNELYYEPLKGSSESSTDSDIRELMEKRRRPDTPEEMPVAEQDIENSSRDGSNIEVLYVNDTELENSQDNADDNEDERTQQH